MSSTQTRKICFVATESEEREFFSEKFPDSDVTFCPKLSDVPDDVEVLSIFINERIDEDILSALPAVRLIATRSMGCDHIDLAACAKREIRITHVSGYGENTVAEHTFALMLALSRRIRESTEAALAGKFTHEKFRGMDLRGSTLGVVGAGRVVISDRFLDSTTVYQGVARKIPAEVTARINAFAVGVNHPDLTFLLDLDRAVAIARMGDRTRDRIERESEAFFAAVRQGYLDLAAREAHRIQVLDASLPPDEIAKTILAIVQARQG